jgi:hypothetical protein
MPMEPTRFFTGHCHAALALAIFVGAMVFVASGVAPRAAQAADEDIAKALRYYEQRAAAHEKFAAKTMWKAAKAARDDTLYRQCVRLSERILVWDPEHKEARAHLGFVSRDKKWVLDRARAGAVIRKNRRKSGESLEAYWERVAAWERKYEKVALTEIAKRFAKLGDECRSRRSPSQSRRAYLRAISLDHDQKRARKGLGYVRVGDFWITEQARTAFESAAAIEDAEREAAWGALLGRALVGSQTEHVRVVSSYGEDTAYVARACELGWALTLAILQRAPDDPALPKNRLRFCLMEQEGDWPKWFHANPRTHDKPGSHKNFGSRGDTRAYWYGARRRPTSTREDVADYVVHTVPEMLLRAFYGRRRAAWIFEGIAQQVTSTVLPESDVRCIGAVSTRYESSNETQRWASSPRWRELVRDLVVKDDDIPLRTLFTQTAAEMNLEESV